MPPPPPPPPRADAGTVAADAIRTPIVVASRIERKDVEEREAEFRDEKTLNMETSC
jgi:hypothetical protein